jgi:hypothetical protein
VEPLFAEDGEQLVDQFAHIHRQVPRQHIARVAAPIVEAQDFVYLNVLPGPVDEFLELGRHRPFCFVEDRCAGRRVAGQGHDGVVAGARFDFVALVFLARVHAQVDGPERLAHARQVAGGGERTGIVRQQLAHGVAAGHQHAVRGAQHTAMVPANGGPDRCGFEICGGLRIFERRLPFTLRSGHAFFGFDAAQRFDGRHADWR